MNKEQGQEVSRREFLIRSGAVLVAPTLLGALACSTSEAESTPEVFIRPDLPSYIRSGPDKPLVSITIDDIEGEEGILGVEQVLDIAAKKEVKLTFFPTGESLETHKLLGYSDVWKRVVDEGHEIGNHGYSHNPLTELTDTEISIELTRTQIILDEILGFEYPMYLMRPPGGTGGLTEGGDPRIMNIVTDMNYSMAMWTIDANNVEKDSPFKDKIVKSATNGSIALTHFPVLAPELFDTLVDELRSKGLAPTTIAGLFED